MKELIVKTKKPLTKTNSLWKLRDSNIGVNRTHKDTDEYVEWCLCASPDELEKLSANLNKRSSVIEVRQRTHRHKWAHLYSTNSITFECVCGEKRTAPATKQIKQRLSKTFNPKRDDDVHFVWHEFTKEFIIEHYPPTFKDVGHDLMRAIEKWAKKYPKDVRILSCDDSYHCGSILVLIEHKAKNSYMGTSVVYIPQCTGEQPSVFFLYPGHTKALISALKTIRNDAVPIEKRVINENKKWRTYLKTLEKSLARQ